MLNILIYISYP